MMRSMYSGVSGLKGHQTKMDVIGNNIANVNTTGFKSGRLTFADTLSQTQAGASAPGDNIGGTNPKQIGLGVGISTIDTLFTDGSVQATGKNTDLCLTGNGLFVVNANGERYYTRNGAFEFDKDGNYVQPGKGYKVQGYMASSDGTLTPAGEPTDIQIKVGKSSGHKSSTLATYTQNLNATPTGYEISNIVVTRADGTTETMDNYSPSGVDGATITLGTSTGKSYVLDSTAAYSFTTGDSLVGRTLFTSTVNSVTADNTGEVGLTLGVGSAISSINGGTTYTIPAANIPSGTFKYGDTYTLTGTIVTNGVTTDGTDTAETTLTVDLNLPDGTVVSGVVIKVPPPENFTYQDGMTVSFDLPIEEITANSGADVTCANGNTVTLDNSLTVNSADTSYTYQGQASDGDVLSVTRQAEITSVSVTTADGTILDALKGQSYSRGGSFYPSITTTINTYDSRGSVHTIPVLFTKTAENNWVLTLAEGATKTTITSTGTDGTTTTEVELTATDLKFDTTGKYLSGTASLSLRTDGTTVPQQVAINLTGLTQYTGDSTIKAEADGYADGTLKSVSIDSSGIITGVYTNGLRKTEAQVAIAQFANVAGLTKVGSSLYQVSNNSGEVGFGSASALGCTITSSALEMSNVDVANEFSDMIITQRGFQSNSKIITVRDEMLETMINMKR